jgi:transposase
MPQNFIECQRDQVFLMPRDLRGWLPADHLVWMIVDAVSEVDLAAFYGDYRLDGHGRAAYEPSMMVTLLLYAYARGQRSSRVIERECSEDIAFRVIRPLSTSGRITRRSRGSFSVTRTRSPASSATCWRYAQRRGS